MSGRDRSGKSGVHLNAGLMVLFVVMVFSTAGAIHYQTPMLGRMAAEFGASPAAIGWVATLSFGGFLAGTVLLVPLGDCYDKRNLILVQMGGLVVALLAMAAAPTLPLLAAAAFIVGICCSVSQHVTPIASELAAPHVRGRTVGTVLSGVFVGILFARLAGGLVAELTNWRWMYVFAAAMVLLMWFAVYARLPSAPPKTDLSYADLVRSMAQLWRAHPPMRRASVIQFLLGIGYGGFWATLAGMLVLLHGLGPGAAGLMAIPGAAGILVSRPAGRWMDRAGAAPVVIAGVFGMIAAFAVLSLATFWVGAVIVGAVLLDCGLSAAMVANQTLVIESNPAARSRASTIFSAHIWGGNAVGALLASLALAHAGWLAVCAISLGAAAVALIIGWRDLARPGGTSV